MAPPPDQPAPPAATAPPLELLADGALLVNVAATHRAVVAPGTAEWWRHLERLDNDLYARAIDVARAHGWII